MVVESETNASITGVTPSDSVSVSEAVRGDSAEKRLVSSPSAFVVSSVNMYCSRMRTDSMLIEASTVEPFAVKLATTAPAPSVPLKSKVKDAIPFASMTAEPFAGSISATVVEICTTSLTGIVPSLLVTVTLRVRLSCDVTSRLASPLESSASIDKE